jgi:hypothetical protein
MSSFQTLALLRGHEEVGAEKPLPETAKTKNQNMNSCCVHGALQNAGASALHGSQQCMQALTF